MDRAEAHDPTQPGGAPTHYHAASSAPDIEQAHSPEGQSKQHGLIASTVKGAFKIYLVPAMRARSALTTLTGGWGDLVAEARQEHEAGRRTDILAKPQAEPAMPAAAPPAPAVEPGPRPSTPTKPIRPAAVGKPRAAGARRRPAAARRAGVTETSPPMPGPAETETAETSPSMPGPAEAETAEASPPPTLVESDESGVEVRPNPGVSPAHATSGVIPHVSPEVAHKLAGDGPIRA